MPKDNIDYSNTIIYKIQCKDPLVKDLYVGHTTNFSQRKYAHKISCKNFPNTKPYNFIVQNGGWDNWDMIEIAKYNCKDSTEARIKEQEHYKVLNSTLNNSNNKLIENDIIEKSDNTYNLSQNSQKNNNYLYNCKICDYYTNKLNDFNKHKMTPKHTRLTVSQELADKLSQNKFKCKCGNMYKHRQSLFKHQKICSQIEEKKSENNLYANEILNMIKTLIKDNQEFTKELVNSVVTNQCDTIKEITKSGINTTNNVNNINSNNKTFNLQLFLNETCKNAMNLTDFVDSIKLQLSDLINIGEVGYVEGISQIITTNLQALDVTERPIHCADKKREIIYIKDEDKWEKEDNSKNKLRKVIKKIAYKNEKLLPQFRENFPSYNDSESKYSDQYSKIVIETLGGRGDNDLEKENKIIKNISKVTTIDKENLI